MTRPAPAITDFVHDPCHPDAPPDPKPLAGRRILLLLLPLCWSAPAVDHAEASDCVTPEIIGVDEGAIQNAGAGAEIWNGGPGDGVADLVRYAVRVSDHAVNSMIRVSWADYEPRAGHPCRPLPCDC